MSIKQNIAEAREEIKELASRIFFHEGVIQKEKEKVSELEEKIKLLTTRKSELAQVVLKKMQCEHEWVLRKIQEDEEVLASLYNEKKEREDSISDIEKNTNEYLKEQTSILATAFLDYMGSHMEEFGTDITKTFVVKEITEKDWKMYGGVALPTGNVGIYDESQKCFVATTIDGDPCFDEKLYDIFCDCYDHAICKYTQRFTNYLLNFKVWFFASLQKEYCFEDSFKLTINNPHFTLELV